jgi:hypothetical protein
VFVNAMAKSDSAPNFPRARKMSIFFFEKVARALPFIKRESGRNYKLRLHTLNRTGPATKERKEEQGEATSPALGGQVSQ